jgi:hypothetical protein
MPASPERCRHVLAISDAGPQRHPGQLPADSLIGAQGLGGILGYVADLSAPQQTKSLFIELHQIAISEAERLSRDFDISSKSGERLGSQCFPASGFTDDPRYFRRIKLSGKIADDDLLTGAGRLKPEDFVLQAMAGTIRAVHRLFLLMDRIKALKTDLKSRFAPAPAI